jgi:anti-sigma regulatory factor (Ser/Thr protein kinase)
MHGEHEPGVMTSPPVDLHEDAIAPSAARTAVTEACRRWHLTELIETTALLVSELVTNAVRHARPPISLKISQPRPGRLHVEVADHSPDPPRPNRHPDATSTGGRGLLIVDALATAWGYRRDGTGKTVWFDLASNPRTSQT